MMTQIATEFPRQIPKAINWSKKRVLVCTITYKRGTI